MIKFFRNIRKSLIEKNQMGKYFKYAIGEIVLVVIGILIALQLNNWNETRKEDIVEISILNELLNDLNSDLISLNEDKDLNQRAIRSNQLIYDHLINKKEYHDSLDVHFGNIQYNTQFTVNTGGFENLKSRGFEIISNDSVRKAIIELQDRWYDYLFTIGDRNNVINFEQFSPIYQKYFTNFKNVFTENLVSFTPLNYEVLKGNTEFLQLISYQKFINENTVQILDRTIGLIKQLMEKIEIELNSKS
jgi:Family of unknown function (DUF6090)